MKRAPAILLFALVAGCGSDAPAPPAPPPPADFTTDEAPPADSVVFLRGRPRPARGDGAQEGDRDPDGDGVEAERVTVDVVARGVGPSVHGAAFRLRWEPEKLGFVEARAGEAWSSRALTLAREGIPGELVVTWTEKGTGDGFDATGETLLGALTFTRKSRDGAAIAFRADRSTLRDPSGRALTVAWRGGRVPAR
ncbi:MAG: hypothetical protein KF764_17255 [Labilithrix sp.]|nr:hypothetical protein [Labilithrix sp.]